MHTEAAEPPPNPAAPETQTPPVSAEAGTSNPGASGTPLESVEAGTSNPAAPGTPLHADSRPNPAAPEPPPVSAEPGYVPLFSRALLALTAAATIAVTPYAAAAIGPAGSGQSAHSVPVYLISRISHDVGHNDWAFQGQDAGRVSWVITYVALAVLWLGVSLWIRTRMRRSGAPGAPEPRRVRFWLRVLLAAWAAELVTGLLTLGAGAYAEWTSTPIGADVLKAADLCSPWWSCVAAVLVTARAERSTPALRAIAGYAALLIIVLMIPLPAPDALKALLIALPAAVPALLTPRQQSEPGAEPDGPIMPSAVAAG